MKPEIRVLGIDDAPFSFHEKYSTVIGVVMRGGGYLECVIRSQVMVDGTEATAICKQMIQSTRHKHQLKAVLLDGACLGGFNVIDIQELSETTGLAIITVTRDEPDFEKIKQALQKHFKDWEARWTVLQKGEMQTISTAHNPIHIKYYGSTLKEAEEIINLTTIRGVIPEPIRVAHLIASGVTRGESYGKA